MNTPNDLLAWENGRTTEAAPGSAPTLAEGLTTNRMSGRRLLPMMMHHPHDIHTGARRAAVA